MDKPIRTQVANEESTITSPQLRALDGTADSAPRRQLIVLALWGIFNKRKCKKLLVYLEAGMSWKAAYSKTKKG